MAINTATAVVAGVLVALGQAGTAHAEPSPAEIEVQIDKQWETLEPTIEHHNKVKAERDATRAKVQELTEKLRPLELQVNLSLSKISAISDAHFKHGAVSTFNAVLSSGSPTTLADQLTLINHMARVEMAQIQDVRDLKAQYDAQKKPLDALLAQQTRQESELASKEQFINAEIKQLNDLRLKVYGTAGNTTNTKPAACPFDYTPDAGGRAAKIACQQIGKPYIWAAEGPSSFDCSGLTKYAWAQAGAGVSLGHYTNWQYQSTKRVSREELRAGDLIFYFSDLHHVAIYVGGGWMVHAPNSGDVVRMERFDRFSIAGYGRPA